MRDLVLKCNLSLGDIVLLTAAVRDLHLCYPGQFRTSVQTFFPELWEQNPYITSLQNTGENAEVVECRLTLIDQSNVQPYHAIHGFIDCLNGHLGLSIQPSCFKGDIYLSDEDKSSGFQLPVLNHEITDFWIIVAGGKHDVTTKWWHPERYQEVVDAFQGRVQFVQVGAEEDCHPPLKSVIDLRGKTNLRQLIRLLYHAQGVLCPVTSLMHLAAAIEGKAGSPINRPCVVVAGGREPAQWEAYPNHQFIHTNGSLLCCDQGGCWKSRTRPLGDNSEFDLPDNLCVDVVQDFPRCMDIIRPSHVIRRIEMYFDGGMLMYHSP